MPKMRFRPALRFKPHWGIHDPPNRPPSRLGKGHSSPTPLSPFGVSIVAPSALARCAPHTSLVLSCFKAGNESVGLWPRSPL